MVEWGVGLDGFSDGHADEFVGVAEGDTLADEVVGEVGGEKERVAGGIVAGVDVDGHGGDHFGIYLKSGVDGVEGVEERFFVFLQVAVVGEGETFEGGEKGDEIAVETSGFATGDFADVGIFFLRHEGAAGGVSIGKGGKGKFGGAPEDEIFAEAREVRADEGEGEKEFGDVIAVGDGIHRVVRDSVEAEFFGNGFAVEVDGGSGESAGAEGGDVEALAAISEASGVAVQHLDVGEKVVSDGDGLAALQVGVTRDHGVGVFLGLSEERFLECDDVFSDGIDFGTAVETCVGGDLVVA